MRYYIETRALDGIWRRFSRNAGATREDAEKHAAEVRAAGGERGAKGDDQGDVVRVHELTDDELKRDLVSDNREAFDEYLAGMGLDTLESIVWDWRRRTGKGVPVPGCARCDDVLLQKNDGTRCDEHGFRYLSPEPTPAERHPSDWRHDY